MKLLAIDYGRRRIGLATSETDLAEPLKVLKIKSTEDALLQVMQVIQVNQVNQVIVGVSEGEMGEESKNFAEILKAKINLPVETFDETLTTYDAQKMSLESGISRKKRKNMEDAYAASIVLQNYLDSIK